MKPDDEPRPLSLQEAQAYVALLRTRLPKEFQVYQALALDIVARTVDDETIEDWETNGQASSIVIELPSAAKPNNWMCLATLRDVTQFLTFLDMQEWLRGRD
jgi:hypothetical protein